MSYQKCIENVTKALKDKLPKESIDKIVKQLSKEADRYMLTEGFTVNKAMALSKVGNEMAESLMQALAIEKRDIRANAKKSAVRKERIAELEAQGIAPDDIVQSQLVGTSKSFSGSNYSVAAVGDSRAHRLAGGMIAELDRNNLFELYHNKDSHRLIARELFEKREGGKPGITGNKEIRVIADIIYKYTNRGVDMINEAGGAISKIDGYIFKQSHNQQAIIKAGFEKWYNDIIKKLDTKETFGNAEPREYLKAAYDNITSGRHLQYIHPDNSRLAGLKGFSNLSKRVSRERELIFKSADDFMDYNDVYGKMSLPHAITAALFNAGRTSALLETFGTNPRAAFEGMLTGMKNKYHGDNEKLSRITGVRGKQLLNQFDELEGKVNIAVGHSSAEAGLVARSVVRMAKLGGAVISAINDIPIKVTQLVSTGGGRIEALQNALVTSFQALGKSDKRTLAAMLGAGLDGMTGSMASRFAIQDNIPGRIMSIEGIYYRATGLSQWTDAQKRGSALAMNASLLKDINKSFFQLNKRRKQYLQRFGIGEQEWDVIRTSATEVFDGVMAIMPDNIQDKEVADKLGALYQDFIDTSVITSGLREKAMLNLGTQRGTPEGEYLRIATMLKSFPLTYTTKALGRLVQDKEYGLIAELAASSLIFGYVSFSATQILNGKEPPSLDKIDTWRASIQKGGFGGIYADMLLGGMFGNTEGFLQGPLIGEGVKIVDLLAATGRGDDVGRRAFDQLVGLVPGNNLFYLKGALDYVILNSMRNMLDPNYLRKQERKYEENYGADYFLPPTKYRLGK